MAGFLYIFLGLVSFLQFCIGDYVDDYCPPSSIISPCDCDGEGLNCMKAKTDSDLQKVFQSIPRPWKFRAIWIQITDMTQVPSFMFRGIEIGAFHLEVNRIHTIYPNAFSGSENSVTTISFFGNDLRTFPFGELKSFKYLRELNLSKNKLTRIPENACDSATLSEILFAENQINYIEPNAFKNCPRLQSINLLHNNLNILPAYSFAMKSHHPQLSIILANNSLANISPLAFIDTTPKQLNFALNRLQTLPQTVFVPLLTRMAKVAGIIDVSYNPFSCQGCDFMWLIVNRDILKFALPGFRCMDGRSVMDLTRNNIWCFT